MNTILFGNGLNMLTDGNASWSDLVSIIDTAKNEERIPFTLQFEAKLSDSIKSYKIANHEILSNITKSLRKYKTNSIYERLASLGVDHYITTNYDFTMKKTLSILGYGNPHKEGGDMYSIRRHLCLEKSGHDTCIWHIHGEIDAPSSIMLGLNYYGAKISRMKDYIDGKYSYDSNKTKISIGPLKTRLQAGIGKPFSWIDLFFVSDIHILGYGLYYDEIDLWWLLSKRKEMFTDDIIGVKPNKIIYYGNADKGKTELLNKLGVDIVDYESYPKKTSSYIKMYDCFIDKISDTL